MHSKRLQLSYGANRHHQQIEVYTAQQLCHSRRSMQQTSRTMNAICQTNKFAIGFRFPYRKMNGLNATSQLHTNDDDDGVLSILPTVLFTRLPTEGAQIIIIYVNYFDHLSVYFSRSLIYAFAAASASLLYISSRIFTITIKYYPDAWWSWRKHQHHYSEITAQSIRQIGWKFSFPIIQ